MRRAVRSLRDHNLRPDLSYNAVMNSEAIQELFQSRPFEPFEVRLSNGDVHQIRNPEYAFVLKSRLIIGYPNSDRVAICSLIHIVSLEPIPNARV